MKRVDVVSKTPEFQVFDVEIPKPKPGELLVKLISSTMHPCDYLRSVEFFGPVTYPALAGSEGFGVVFEDTDVDQEKSLKGKHVGYWSYTGSSWAEYATIPKSDVLVYDDTVVPKEDISITSNLFLNPITAVALLNLIEKGGHKGVIINAASGQVSKMLIRLCKKKSINTVAIVRNSIYKETLLSNGATIVLNENDENFGSSLEESAKNLEATLFIDSIGGASLLKHLLNSPNETTLISYGLLSGFPLSQEEISLVKEKKNIDVGRFFMFTEYFSVLDAEQRNQLSTQIIEEIKTTFATDFSKTIKLDEIPTEFHKYFANASAGKVVIDLRN